MIGDPQAALCKVTLNEKRKIDATIRWKQVGRSCVIYFATIWMNPRELFVRDFYFKGQAFSPNVIITWPLGWYLWTPDNRPSNEKQTTFIGGNSHYKRALWKTTIRTNLTRPLNAKQTTFISGNYQYKRAFWRTTQANLTRPWMENNPYRKNLIKQLPSTQALDVPCLPVH